LQAQAFIADAFLALMLSLLIVHIITSQEPLKPTCEQARLAYACYDIVNAFYMNRGLYQNVSNSLELNASISPGTSQMVRNHLIHYAQLLDVTPLSFELKGLQKEVIQVPEVPQSYTERCCFPIVINGDGATYIACFEVGA